MEQKMTQDVRQMYLKNKRAMRGLYQIKKNNESTEPRWHLVESISPGKQSIKYLVLLT